MARRWRNWAFESAALDLALRQAGARAARGARARGRARCASSTRSGSATRPRSRPSATASSATPTCASSSTPRRRGRPSSSTEVAATGAVDIIDFKGRYGLPVEDEFALLAMYEEVLERFDGVILEDPHDRPDVAALIAPHAARVSFDAPIATAADIEGADFGARTVNVKPSRIGGLRALLDVYAHCEAEGLRMYGGGMGEVGIARGQIELLAVALPPRRPERRRAVGATTCPSCPTACPRARSRRRAGARLPLELDGARARAAPAARPKGVPSESRHTDHASPGWMTEPPSAATRSSAAAMSATAKYGQRGGVPRAAAALVDADRGRGPVRLAAGPLAGGPLVVSGAPRRPSQKRWARPRSSAGNSMRDGRAAGIGQRYRRAPRVCRPGGRKGTGP